MTYSKWKKLGICGLLLLVYSSFVYVHTYLVATFGETPFYSFSNHLLSFFYSLLALVSSTWTFTLVRKNKQWFGRIQEYVGMLALSSLMFFCMACLLFLFISIGINGWVSMEVILANGFFATFTYHLFIACFFFTVVFFQEKSKAEREAVQLRQYQAETELNLLKQQLDPHFLFNNLNILSAFIHKQDHEEAQVFLEKFVEIFRYRLKYRQSDFVKLEEELKHAEDYLHLIHRRFKNHYQWEFFIDRKIVTSTFIIPGTLQILLENVVKHNEASDELPIRIYLSLDHGSVKLLNNIQVKAYKIPSLGMGLSHLKSLYKLLGLQMEIDVQEDSFQVTIPLISQVSLP
ncbi:MAG: histidine kinase [Bacteroidota bacterium]